ncbi:MAG: hypothetical protein V1779_13855 [bacterium]
MKIKFQIISLIPGDYDSSYNCDCLSFKSSKDIDSYIGNEFDFVDFYNKDFIKQIETSAREIDNIDNEEKYMVYVYPNHRSMMSILERASNIQLFDNEHLTKKFLLPEGGILNILNKDSGDLEVELITNKIEN